MLPEKKMSAFESRWGFHSCDYETFKKLKKLHKHYWKAVRGLAAWFRWDRKQPQNRILTKRLKDASGRVTGREVIGPWEEPKYCTVFGQPTEKRDWLTIPEHLDDHGIIAAYLNARIPRKMEDVTPLAISAEEIDALYEKLK